MNLPLQLQRLADIVLACVLVGVVAAAYAFTLSGQFDMRYLVTVPFNVVVALVVGFGGATSSPLLLLLAVATIAVLLIVYFADRVIPVRWLRVIAEAAVLALHTIGVNYALLYLRS